MLRGKYAANLGSIPATLDDASPTNIVLVDDSSSYGATTDEIACTIKEAAALAYRKVKVCVVVLAHGLRGDAVSNAHLSDEVHREIEEAVDASAAEHQAPRQAGRHRGAVYIKFATQDNGNEQVVVGGYGGSTVRQSYTNKPFDAIVGTRDRKHPPVSVENGHCAR